MPKVILNDFSQIRFDQDAMQVVSISPRKKELDLPLTKGPVNFTVLKGDGTRSNRWKIKINAKGDAYVICRDIPNLEKVSLHASGRQHISIDRKVAQSLGATNRFGPEWREPEFDSEAIPTFTLLFPPWGVGLAMDDFVKGIKKDELLIVGHSEKLVVVAFFLVAAGKNMRGHRPHIVIGRLPVMGGKILHVIAWKERQNNLMDQIRSAFPHASQAFSEIDLEGGDYTMCFQGYRKPNSAYMVRVPVRYTSPTSDKR